MKYYCYTLCRETERKPEVYGLTKFFKDKRSKEFGESENIHLLKTNVTYTVMEVNINHPSYCQRGLQGPCQHHFMLYKCLINCECSIL